MTERKPQFDRLPQDEYDRDLSPDPLAGQNLGPLSSEIPHRTAYDVKAVHRCLRDFPDDELRAIPVLEEGTALQQGATYLNLRRSPLQEITASGGMRAGPDDTFIPKDEVPYSTWNKLRGIDDPERTGGEPYRRD